LVNLCALLEIDLDFAEEGLVVISSSEVGAKLTAAAAHVRSLASSYQEGRLYREGVSVVFAGKPNAGKSSLFNALLKEERAIVTAVAGTTRDYLEESVTFDGLTFRLFDTAGLRSGADTVEQIGIERTRTALRAADIVVVVEDVTAETDPHGDADAIPAQSEGQQIVLARNKIDLAGRAPGAGLPDDSGQTVVYVSALTGEGIHDLRAALIKLASSTAQHAEHDVVVTNRRHLDALLRAAEGLDRAHDSLVNGGTNDLIALDLHEAVNTLAEITGEMTSEDILNEIFARFCIGK
jgi:tRNA modification GTPase